MAGIVTDFVPNGSIILRKDDGTHISRRASTAEGRGLMLSMLVGDADPGDEISVGPGTFTLDADLVIPPGTTLTGSGKATIINFPVTGNLVINSDNCSIRKLQVVGTVEIGNDTAGVKNPKLDHVHVDASGRNYGLYVHGAHDDVPGVNDFTVLDLEVTNCTFINATIHNAYLYGSECGRPKIIGNEFNNAGECGLKFDHGTAYAPSEGAEGGLLNSNHFTSNGTYGLHIVAVHDLVVDSNSFSENAGGGVYWELPIDSTLVGNHFEENHDAGVTQGFALKVGLGNGGAGGAPAGFTYGQLTVVGNHISAERDGIILTGIHATGYTINIVGNTLTAIQGVDAIRIEGYKTNYTINIAENIIYGEGALNAGNGITIAAGSSTDGARIKVSGNIIVNQTYCISITNVYNTKIFGNRLSSCTIGINSDSGIIATGNGIRLASAQCINIVGGSGSDISDNRFIGGTYAVYMNNHASAIIKNNYCDSQTVKTICADTACNSSTIAANRIINSPVSIDIIASYYMRIEDNVTDDGALAAPTYGIRLGNACIYPIIVGNTITHNSAKGYGISVVGTVAVPLYPTIDNNTVIMNALADDATYGNSGIYCDYPNGGAAGGYSYVRGNTVRKGFICIKLLHPTDVIISNNVIGGASGGGGSTGIYLGTGAASCKVRSNDIVDCQYGIDVNNCTNAIIDGNVLHGTVTVCIRCTGTNPIISRNITDTAAFEGILISGSTNARIEGNVFKTPSGNQTHGLYIDASTGVTVFGNSFMNCTNKISTNGVVTYTAKHNIGFVTENSGTATVANGTTTIAVNHGLSVTPTAGQISIYPTNNLGNAAKFWVDTITSTQFTVNVNADPGAGTATFAWNIQVA